MRVYCRRISCRFNKPRVAISKTVNERLSYRCAKLNGTVHLNGQGHCEDYEKETAVNYKP